MLSFCKRLLIIVVILFPGVSFAYFHTSGQHIVDSDGNQVMLRGYGLGGWLVPEGYMLHTPGYGSPSSIRTMIVDLVGDSNANLFYNAYRANYVSEADIALIASWGFNSVRLPFHYLDFYDPNIGYFNESGFELLDNFLAWCEAANLYVILDMHCAPGGQNADNISDSDGVARLWTEPTLYQWMTILIWEEIAARYADNERIVGYDLLNEPVLPSGHTNQELRNLYVDLTGAIRGVDPNHILFIEGNWYATNFDLLTPPWDDNMVYSFHKYWNSTSVNSIQYLLNLRNTYNVPLWLGETGENSNPWFYEVVQVMEAQQIGWCWWAHKKMDTITSPLSAPITPQYQTVLNYWNGSGSNPGVTYATNALLGMAENLLIENCDFRPDVIKALMNPTFGTQEEPFTNLEIPGFINATDYDFGSNGVGYTDTNYKNESGSSGTGWNFGYQYRNDGVDIERSSDPLGFAYNVGWIESGERLNYTVNIQQAGTYEAHFRVASMNNGGRINMLIDGNLVGSTAAIPSTNGWQNWITVPIPEVILPAGQHQMSLLFVPGGFNLNRMTFFYTGTGIEDTQAGISTSFDLLPNYPNPFQNTTFIDYTVQQSGKYEINIYNTAGQWIRQLVNNYYTPGDYQQTWDGRNDQGHFVSAGHYLIRLSGADGVKTRPVVIVR